METNIKIHLKKIIALVLSVSMVFGIDNGYCLNSVYADSLQPETVEVTEALMGDEATETEEEILEEEAALEESDTELIEEAAVETEDITNETDALLAEGMVRFEDPRFYLYFHNKYFFSYEGDSELTAAIRGLKKLNSEGNFDESTSGYIDSTQLAKITELEFVYDKEYMEAYASSSPYSKWDDYYQIDFSELNKFPNLRKVTIYDTYLCKSVDLNSKNNATTIDLPDSMQTVLLYNCKFYSYADQSYQINWCKPDFSNCVNLNYLEIVNCEFKEAAECKEIKGLNVRYSLDDTSRPEDSPLKNLNKIKIDNTNIERLCLAKEGVLSEGLLLSANNCTNLELFSSGGYKLISGIGTKGYENAPCFKACKYLEIAEVLGLCNGNNQGIDFSECERLKNLSLNYYFTDASYTYKIKATGNEVTKANYPDASFSVSYASPDTAKGKFDLEAFNCYLTDAAKSDEYKSYFVQKEYTGKKAALIVFAQDVVKYEKDSKIRSYDDRPIVLNRNQTIGDNRPYFYAANGTLLQGIKYTITTEILEKPSEATEGYKVISVDESSEGKTVKAENPGKAKLTVSVASEYGGISASQIIYVYNVVKSVKFEESANTPSVLYENQKNDIYLDINTEYPSLNCKAEYFRDNYLFESSKDGGKNWSDKQCTPSGLQVYKSDAKIQYSNEKIRVPITLDTINELEISDYSLKVSMCGITSPNIFSAKTFGVEGGGKMMYYSSNSTGDKYIAEEGTLKLPDSSLYKPDTLRISLRNPEVYSKFVKHEQKESAPNEYRIYFHGNGDKNEQRNIAYGLGSQNKPKYILDIQLEDKNGNVHNYTRTYDLYGRFSAKYYDVSGNRIVRTQNFTNAEVYFIPDESPDPRYNNFLELSDHPHIDGYELTGWYSDDDILVPRLGKGDLGDINLHTKYRLIDYKITYVLYRGQNSPDNPASYSIKSDTITLKEPTRNDSKFLGWFTSEDGKEPVTRIDAGSMGDITLYARWELKNTHKHTMIADEYVAPTCTKPGKTEGLSCGVCMEVFKEQTEIPALGHNLGEGIVTKEPTEDATGIITYRCLNSGCDYKEEKKIPLLEELGDVLYEDAEILTDPDKDITDTTISVTGVPDSIAYTGKNIEFDVRVYAGNTLLRAGKDYSVKYVNNKNVPDKDATDNEKPAVIITGLDRYKDSEIYEFKPIYFDIKPLDLSAIENIYVSNTVKNVSKKSKFVKPVPAIYINGKKLSKKDYSVDYGKGNENGFDASVAAEHEITITGCGNYTGSIIATHEYVDATLLLSKAKISGIKKSLAYKDGDDVKQSGYSVKIKVGSSNIALSEGTDYAVSYVANRNVGTATMIFVATPGNSFGLVGEKRVTFKVAGSPMSKLQYTFDKSVEYTGLAIKPGLDEKYELKIHDKSTDKDLVYGEDFEITYSNNVQADKKNGKATMQITGKGMYSGTVTKRFLISPIDLGQNESAQASIVPGSVKIETSGKNKDKYTAEVVVECNSKVLLEGKDYTITYKNNTGKGNKTPMVVVKGINNYSGGLEVPFSVSGDA